MNDLELRDYFAGQVIAGMQAGDDQRCYGDRENKEMTLDEWRKQCRDVDAKYAYEMADAMIKARSA